MSLLYSINQNARSKAPGVRLSINPVQKIFARSKPSPWGEGAPGGGGCGVKTLF